MNEWYVLRTQPMKEFASVEILTSRGLRAFCPTETKWRRIGPKKKRAPYAYPMLPRYIFASGADPWEIVRTHRHRCVQGVVGIAGRPAEIPERVIERLARLSGTPIPTRTAPIRRSFVVGDQVEIIRGPFQGYLVPIESINGRSAKVLMKLFNSPNFEVEIALEDLQAA